MMRVADYIVERLSLEGVKHVFMVTGRGALFLTDAVARCHDIKAVCTHHEQAAAYAAVAYAQYNESLGACLVSTGCASTNAVTGVLGAWQDGVPCIVVSGQNKLNETSRHTGVPLRTWGQQEFDIVQLVQPITNYAVMITDPKRIAYELDKALYLAQHGRKGPVWLDVPLDVQNMRVEPAELERYQPEEQALPVPSAEDLAYVEAALRSATRPVLLLGNGIRSAGAIAELEAFLDVTQIPVTFAASAVDIHGASNPLSLGTVGSVGGTRAANFALQNSDLLLVLGNRLSPITTGPSYESFARAAKTIVVDIDPVEHSKNTVRIDRLILSDVKAFLAALLEKNIQRSPDAWNRKCEHWKEIFPLCEDKYKQTEKVDLFYFADALSEVLDERAVVVSDSGLEELILPSTVRFRKGQRCVHPASQGSMGYALPAAVGAQLASDQQTIAVIGDGSVMMNLQELQTVRYHSLPIKLFVINNNVYSVIRKRQVELFRNRTIGTDPGDGVGCPSFGKVASAFDIPYVRIDDSADLKARIAAVLAMPGPVLCEVMAVEDQEYFRSSHGLNSKRRIVQRPLEDLAPFIDRSLFLSEMVIPPLD
jgi:acetolactate synthase-1/2/3 large subunit